MCGHFLARVFGGSEQRSGQSCSRLQLVLGALGRGMGGLIGRGRLVALAAVLAVLAVANSASAQTTDWSLPASYDLGVTVAILWPIVVGVISAVLLPMIVFSLCLAVVYLLWSFAKGKAFGSA